MAMFSGFSHEKWWFAIVMLNYQRVCANPSHGGFYNIVLPTSVELNSSSAKDFPEMPATLPAAFGTTWLCLIVGQQSHTFYPFVIQLVRPPARKIAWKVGVSHNSNNSRTGWWYANNELVTGANLNQLIIGGPHIVWFRGRISSLSWG